MIELTEGTYFAEVQNEGVFMNLQSDSYYGLDIFGTKVLNCLLEAADELDARSKIAKILQIRNSEAAELIKDTLTTLKDLNFAKTIPTNTEENPLSHYILETASNSFLMNIESTKMDYRFLLKSARSYIYYRKKVNTMGLRRSFKQLAQESRTFNEEKGMGSLRA